MVNGRLSKYIVWRSGKAVKSWWTVHCAVRRHRSLGMALAGPTGVSGGSAHTIPRMLMPRNIGGWVVSEIKSPKYVGDGIVDSCRCHRVQGKNYNGDPIELWIDPHDWLIRKIKTRSCYRQQPQRFEVISTTVYKPRRNQKISKIRLVFGHGANS